MELTGHTGVVVAADWMMEGNQVITASWDRTAILFDAETGDQITCLTGKWKIISRKLDTSLHDTGKPLQNNSFKICLPHELTLPVEMQMW